MLRAALDRRAARVGLDDGSRAPGSGPVPARAPVRDPASALTARHADRRQAAGVGERLVAAFDELGAAGPQVVVAEDLQWADPASLELLGRIGDRLAGTRTALVATIRAATATAGVAALVTSWARSGVGERLYVGPLSDADAAALAARRLGATLGPRVRREVARAGGNPLLVEAVVGRLVADGLVRPDTSGSMVLVRRPDRTALRLEDMPHFDHVGGPTRDLLGVAAVLGPSVSVSELRAVAGVSAAELLGAVREATAAGILSGDGDRLAFCHGLVRDALYEDLAPNVRSELHRAAAAHLETTGAPPALVAEHLLRSRPRPADAAWLARLAATTMAGVATREVLAGEADSRSDDAAAVARGVLGAAPAAELVGPLQVCLVQSLHVRGNWAEAGGLAEALVGRPGVVPADRAELQSVAAMSRLAVGDLAAAERLADGAVADARRSGQPVALVHAFVAAGQVASRAGRLAEAACRLEEAVEASVAPMGPVSADGLLARALRALALADVDRLDDARKVALDALWSAEAGGTADPVATAGTVAACVSLWRGDVAEALDELEAQERLGETAGAGWRPLGAAVGCLAALWRFGPVAARRWADQLEAVPGEPERMVRGVGMVARARAALAVAEESPLQALAVLEAAWAVCERLSLPVEAVAVGPMLAGLAAAHGREDAAAAAVVGLESLAAANPGVEHVRASALWAAGLARRDPIAVRQAAVALRSAGRWVEAGHADEAAALAFVERGDPRQARAAGHDALRDLGRAGAVFELRRFRAGARRQGIALKLAGGREGQDSPTLTRTEAIVAGYVAEGLSNPDIAQRMVLSRRTVESHVSRILRKLHLSSRTELAVAVAGGTLAAPGGTPATP